MNRALSPDLASLPYQDTPSPTTDFFRSVLDSAEMGVAVLDEMGRARYLNLTARRLLGAELELPAEASILLRPMMEQVRNNGQHVIERWTYGELVLRARLRLLPSGRMMVLELTVVNVGTAGDIAHALAQRLGLRITDARLLSLLWQGNSNAEIARAFQIPVGTVKSRLNRLYQTLGVRSRSAAVLCAAEVLSMGSNAIAAH